MGDSCPRVFWFSSLPNERILRWFSVNEPAFLQLLLSWNVACSLIGLVVHRPACNANRSIWLVQVADLRS